MLSIYGDLIIKYSSVIHKILYVGNYFCPQNVHPSILRVCIGTGLCRQEHAKGIMWMGVCRWKHADGSIVTGAIFSDNLF